METCTHCALEIPKGEEVQQHTGPFGARARVQKPFHADCVKLYLTERPKEDPALMDDKAMDREPTAAEVTERWRGK